MKQKRFHQLAYIYIEYSFTTGFLGIHTPFTSITNCYTFIVASFGLKAKGESSKERQ